MCSSLLHFALILRNSGAKQQSYGYGFKDNAQRVLGVFHLGNGLTPHVDPELLRCGSYRGSGLPTVLGIYSP